MKKAKKKQFDTYFASEIEVLRFSRIPYSNGITVPPEVHTTFPKTIKVLYGDDPDEKEAGTALLRRTNTGIMADIVLKSKMKDREKALVLMSKLYPAVAYEATEFVEDIILNLKVIQLFLTQNTNHDEHIQPLGDRVAFMPAKKDLH